MRATIAHLDGSTTPALLQLIPQVWGRDWNADFVRAVFDWRYCNRPSRGDTWLAFDGSTCVAMVDTYLRSYALDGRQIAVRETTDWFCLPRYRPFGLGLKLLRLLMELPEPLLSIGGTETNISLLPRLGWKNISGVQSMVLPTTLRGAAHDVLRRRVPRFKGCAFIIPHIVPLRRLHAPIAPAGVARIEEMQPDRQFDIPGQQRNGLRALLDRVDLEWIYAAPRGLFEPVVLVFWLAGEAVGLSLSRFEPSRGSVDGRIVHLQIASPAQEIADWIIAETARWLIQRGVGFIRCRASSPQTIRALQKAGFMARAEPGFWWAKDGSPPPARMDLGYLHIDDVLPLYERWVRRFVADSVRAVRGRLVAG